MPLLDYHIDTRLIKATHEALMRYFGNTSAICCPRNSIAMSRQRKTRGVKPHAEGALRIIGGRYRGSKLGYAGDPRVRPMKDRVRESVFNLVGPSIRGKHAVDLFAGTGALGLEAISRGARKATLVECHFPTARIVAENVKTLAVEDRVEVVTADVFVWAERFACASDLPQVVFCSPPYRFYQERAGEMLKLIGTFVERAPADSIMVVEASQEFDCGQLPQPDAWDVRTYPPAVIALLRLAGRSGQ